MRPSWMVFFGCLGVVFGMAWGSWGWGIGVGIALLLTLSFFIPYPLVRRDRAPLIGVCILGVLVGCTRYSLAGPASNSIANDVGRSAIVEGRVVAKDLNDTGVAYVIDLLLVDDASRADRVRLEAPISSDASIGSYVRTSCVLEQPKAFDGFAYDRFLAAKSIYAICASSAAPFVVDHDRSMSDRFWFMIGALHEWIDDRARSMLPEPQATLLLGLLIGENDFSSAWKEKFQITGTSHIVAASGYNVALVSELVLIALISLGLYRRQAYPIVLGGIVLFAIVAGAEGAVIRAAVMGALVITARHVGRKTTRRNILVFTVAGMLLVEPRLLRDDVGFQLSVMATLGLILGTDRISSLLKRIPTTFGIRESLATTLAATIATLPITMLSFGQVSLFAPIVNVFILPFIPYAMALGLVAIIVSSIVHAFGAWIALPAWTLLTTMTSVIDAFSRIPFASIAIDSRVITVISIVVLAGITRVLFRLPQSFERNLDAWNRRRVVTICAALVCLFVLNIGAIAFRSGRWNGSLTRVFVFDVGQGDGILIDGSEKDIVMDGGPTRFGLLEHMALVRFPWERQIDVVIATHPHADHVSGLIGLLGTYDVDEVLHSGSVYSAPAAEAFARIAPHAAVGSAERSWRIGTDSTLGILWPLDASTDHPSEHVHARSIVARLTVGERAMLFTGDAESDVETALVRDHDLGRVDVLKVGHHGSDTSTSREFLQRAMPSMAVISLGQGNSYGHPTPFVLGRLRAIGARILRTDEEGTIRIDFWRDGVKTSGD